MREKLIGAEVIYFPPNRDIKPLHKNPGTLTQEAREMVRQDITPTLEEKALTAIESAIVTLDIVQIKNPSPHRGTRCTLDPDEIRSTLFQLRAARHDLIAELGR